MRLEGKVALITGGNKGIGLAIAKAYAREWATIILLARDAEANQQAVGRITSQGGRAYSTSCDLRDFHSLPGVVAQAVELAAHGDILVNNAGIVELGRDLRHQREGPVLHAAVRRRPDDQTRQGRPDHKCFV
jgi:NAD(P)-dependent dehydrogenase (short-subunit alcohol dehydrogenase family)